VRAVSDRFANALTGSSVIASRVRLAHHLVRGGDGLMTPIGPALPILDGTVTLDGTADERGRVELTLAPYWPEEGQDQPNAAGSFATTADTAAPGKPVFPDPSSDRLDGTLAPYGNLLLVETGVEYGAGSVEYVQLGYYRIEEIEQDDEPNGSIRVTARDLMSFLIDSRMVYEQSFAAGATMTSIFQALVIADPVYAWPGMPYGFTATDLDLDPTFAALTLDASRTTEGERFAFLDDLVRSRGYIWYWNQIGQLTVTTAPDPTVPLADIAAGTGGTLLRVGRKLTRDGAYSIVRADSADISGSAMVRYVAYNNEGTETYGAVHSPTNLYMFGAVPLYYSSPFITNDAQAGSAALSRYADVKGIPFRRTLAMRPNAALEPFDPVTLWPSGTSDQSTAENHILATIQLPLVAGESAVTTKEWRLV
jgi:hypothetical protein